MQARQRVYWNLPIFFLLWFSVPLRAQDDAQAAAATTSHAWEFHYQSTLIGQGVLPFDAAYSGANSLEPHGEIKDTFSFDVTARVRLWRGGEFAGDILSWQGYGLSKTTGVAGFPSGEAYRAGKTYPDVIVTRAYLLQTIPLGGDNHSGSKASNSGGSRLTLAVGHMPVTDFLDKNAYANDARGQFMNWALVNNAAWDYPANSLGFSNGVAAELSVRDWSARLAFFQVPRFVNGVRMDWNIAQAHSLNLEVERRYAPAGRQGKFSLLSYYESAHMGNYQDSLSRPQDISAAGQLGYRAKVGFGLNLEQEIRKDLGAFARLGWNDGRNQTWAFTDVDRTASAGLSWKGGRWRRPGDVVGLAGVVNGISAAHRQFLANGGLGITAGDGRLNYGREQILETYYSFATHWNVSASPDFQFVSNPAYNRDRGPAAIFALRLHWEK